MKQYCLKSKLWHAARVRRYDKLFLLVLKKENRKQIQIHYEGWGSEHDDWVSIDQVFMIDDVKVHMYKYMGMHVLEFVYTKMWGVPILKWQEIKENYYGRTYLCQIPYVCINFKPYVYIKT